MNILLEQCDMINKCDYIYEKYFIVLCDYMNNK